MALHISDGLHPVMDPVLANCEISVEMTAWRSPVCLQPRSPGQRRSACHAAELWNHCDCSKRPDLHVFKEFTKRTRLAVVVDSFLAQLPRTTVLKRSTGKVSAQPMRRVVQPSFCCTLYETQGWFEGTTAEAMANWVAQIGLQWESNSRCALLVSCRAQADSQATPR